MTAKCKLSIGSVTYAQKAMRALAVAAIYSETVRLDGRERGQGCVYGVELACSQIEIAKRVLGAAGIKASVLTEGRGGK